MNRQQKVGVVVSILAFLAIFAGKADAQLLNNYESQLKTITANSGGTKVLPTISAGADAVRLFLLLAGCAALYVISEVISSGKSSLLINYVIKMVLAIVLVSGSYQLVTPIINRATTESIN